MSEVQPVQNFSTDELPSGMRFEYWMSVLHGSMWQVTEWRNIPADFNVKIRAASFGCLSAIVEDMTAHHSRRTQADVDRSAERSFHIFVSLKQAWAFTHLGQHEGLEAGDIVMMGEGTHETHVPTGFNGVIVKCPESWIQTWLPDPYAIAGRTIKRDSGWGRVLSPMLTQLTPEFVAGDSLPSAVLVDQVGAVLALIAGEAEKRAMPDLLAKARGCIRERCTEVALTAAEVGTFLNVPPRVLHAAFGTAKTTFAVELTEARLGIALPMLARTDACSPTVSEIAKRSGFSNASYFSKVIRQRTGLAPEAFRNAHGAR